MFQRNFLRIFSRKLMLVSAALLLTVGVAGAQTVLFEKNFEADDGGATLDPAALGTPTSAQSYWGRHDNTSDTDAIFTNVGGSFWLGGTDIDAGVTSADTLGTANWDINISGMSDLQFSGLFGAAQNAFEQGASQGVEHLKILYSIDGGAQAELLSFEATGSGTSLFQNGVGGTELTKAMKSFSAAITGTGNNLTLIVSGRSSNPAEALAVDNLQVTGVPEPMTMSLLAVGGLALLRRRRA